NTSSVKEFILLGLSVNQGVKKICFVTFLSFYLMILAGNLLIVSTIISSQRLNSPMYFFLGYLSFVDVCYSSVTAPKMIADLLAERKTISFGGCVAQLFGAHFFGCTEIFILTVMAYDRYVAICRPLHYATLMTRRLKVCWALVSACWAGGFLHSLVHTLLTVQLPFCGPNTIDNYFCDVPLIIQLACTDLSVTEWLMAANSGLMSLLCFLVLLASYIFILLTIRVHFAEGCWKVLSTCGSHMVAVSLFFGPCILIYLQPFSAFPSNRHICMTYTVFSPLMNPLVYTLRNKEVKASMWKLWKSCRA
ncbi:O1509 protein, partial [Tricholaema leucomelas]|nr:O1509 protein [Tricholaema leucomelas]